MRSMDCIQLTGMIFHGNILSLTDDEEVISLSHAKVYVLSDSVSCLGKVNQNPQANTVWEDKLTWFKSSSQYRTLDTIDGETDGIRVEYSPRIHHIAARGQNPKIYEQNERPSTIPRTNYLHVDVQWHHMGELIKDNEQECIAYATLVSVFAKRFPAGRWSFLGPGSEQKW